MGPGGHLPLTLGPHFAFCVIDRFQLHLPSVRRSLASSTSLFTLVATCHMRGVTQTTLTVHGAVAVCVGLTAFAAAVLRSAFA